MDILRTIFDDLRNDFRRFSKILVYLVILALGILTIAVALFSYEITNADIPCGFISCLIIAVIIHQIKLSDEL